MAISPAQRSRKGSHFAPGIDEPRCERVRESNTSRGATREKDTLPTKSPRNGSARGPFSAGRRWGGGRLKRKINGKVRDSRMGKLNKVSNFPIIYRNSNGKFDTPGNVVKGFLGIVKKKTQQQRRNTAASQKSKANFSFLIPTHKGEKLFQFSLLKYRPSAAVEKSLGQEVRQKRDISERRSKAPSTLTFFATRPTVSLCDLSGIILHQK